MQYTDEDVKFLLSFRDNIDYDPIKCKQQVKERLLKNKHIIHVLNNEDLESKEAEPDDYFNVNIYPMYVIKPIQTNVKNFITFQVNYTELPQFDKTKKYLQIIFVIFCNVGNIVDEDTSLPRHDLLGSLIQDQFNFTNICGKKIKLVDDKEITIDKDNDFVGRQMVFEQFTDNNLVRTRDGIARFTNKETYVAVPQSED